MFEGPLKSRADWFHVERPSRQLSGDEIERRYLEYRAEHVRRMAKELFPSLKSEVWFQEKYDPELLAKSLGTQHLSTQERSQRFSAVLTGVLAELTPETAPANLLPIFQKAFAPLGGFLRDIDSPPNDLPADVLPIGPSSSSSSSPSSSASSGNNNLAPSESSVSSSASSASASASSSSTSSNSTTIPNPEAAEQQDQVAAEVAPDDVRDAEATPSTAASGADSSSTLPPGTTTVSSVKPPAPPDPGTVFLKALPLHANRASLLALFETVGPVARLTIVEPRTIDDKRRFGWVSFADESHGPVALNTLNGARVQPPDGPPYELFLARQLPRPQTSNRFQEHVRNKESLICSPVACRPTHIATDLKLSSELVSYSLLLYISLHYPFFSSIIWTFLIILDSCSVCNWTRSAALGRC